MRNIAVAFAAAALLAACDQNYSGYDDALVDLGVDVPGGDSTGDSTSGCTYPEGPYGFSALGDTVAPMSWPGAYAGVDETYEADLEALYCDPSVNSIFIMVATYG